MNATPATAARQIVTARRVNRVQVDRLAYSTSTGDAPRREVPTPEYVEEHEPHCFVCGRHTDHWGEHDDMVDAGTAYYTPEGDVWPTGSGPQVW